MKRLAAVFMATAALLAGACGASGDDDAGGEPEETTTSAATGGGGEAGFPDIDGPLCGEGDFSVQADEAGLGDDALYLGVTNDRSSDIRPGLNKMMYDTAVAFAGWCNEQGGIGGLPIEIVDLDAALFNVEAVMTTACTDVFALVGGGLAQDQLQFSGKEGSDILKCGLIDIPGFAVSAVKADSEGQVQPLPNPGNSQNNTWFRDFKVVEPENSKSWTVLWGELPALELVKTKNQAAVAEVGGIDDVGEQSYPATGAADWTPLVQRMIGDGATSFSWVGEVENLTSFLKSAREQRWEGTPLLETNMYDQKLAESTAAEGAVLRMGLHSLEEADEWPAIQQYLDMLEQYSEDGDIGALGIQAMSAWLLFTVAANACGEENDGVIDRACILEQAAAVDDWTGGGLHAPQDPAPAGEAVASPCGMLIVVKDGAFERLYPELGGENDDVDGFHCPENGVTTLD
ncbi:MAG: ABC transporter substrate-binding protein [Actinomycetota bacterium]|nr:ABC transporter substrate-binding protein [Actinomycetota bacterium]